MILPKFSSLYWRIFAIFWLTILLVLLVALSLPSLDPRKIKDVPPPVLKRLNHFSEKITKEYTQAQSLPLALQQIKKKHRKRGLPQHVYFTTLDNTVIHPEIPLKQLSPKLTESFNHFAAQMANKEMPKQRLYGHNMLIGPFKTNIAQQKLNMYVSYRWHRPPPILFMLFDKPLQLLFAVMLVSTPLLLWLSWALSQPAMRLEKAAKQVANGQFEEIPNLEKGTSEFQQAGASFNQMILALNQMISGQKRLLSDISHELRSPLTRLRMANALAIRKQGESDELKRIDIEAQRLEEMISQLLDLSKKEIDSHQNKELIQTAQILQSLFADAAFESKQMDKQLHTREVVNAQLHANIAQLTSAIENIIRNAIKYAKKNIWISTQIEEHSFSLVVEDDGEGVDEYELEQIFRPFYRVSSSRNRETGGTGLGLSIAQSAIQQHNGKIAASQSQHGGLQIKISIPISSYTRIS